ncbi:Kinesin-like protein kif20a [Arthrobotrys musiformis]|uniref:Kinesin-like protein kif20a n=1 Tax=Arthrobotrys musiformis TaxID=47236 RepID=A0AAV9WLY4_9PEZI
MKRSMSNLTLCAGSRNSMGIRLQVSPRSGILWHIRHQSTVPAKAKPSPLAGVRVLDLTRVLAGPYCTQILGDLGADVIKVEHVTRGDDTRAWGPPYAPRKDGKSGPGESAYFLAVRILARGSNETLSNPASRNKRSLALDFRAAEGQAIVKALARTSDVLVENYLPGTLAKYGLDYETLKKENKGLIYASITGYGQTGPYSDRAGYDVMVEAEMGLMHITGERDGSPVKVGVAVTDLTTGLYTSNAILAALLSRASTSQGQHIDMSLSDCQVATLANIASSVLVSGKRDGGRWGTAHPSIVPYEAFPTSDGSILLGGGNDRLFGILCNKIGYPEWASDERFVTNEKRVEYRYILVPMIGEETKRRTTQEWLEIFEGSGMPYAAVNDVYDTLHHDHVLARDMVKEVHHEACGPIKLINTPFKFSDAEVSIRHAPPTLGEDTNDILQELGFTSDQIDGLKTEGVVA